MSGALSAASTLSNKALGEGPSGGQAYEVRLDRLARMGSLAVAVVGALVLCGWYFDIPWLRSLVPSLPPMKINTAFTFIAAGIALWLLRTGLPQSRSFHVARGLALFVIVVGALTFIEHVFGLELGIDQLVPSHVRHAAYGAHPGRMSPAATVNLLFIGAALLALRSGERKFAACTHWLVVPPLFVSGLAVLGYAYGVSALYEIKLYTSMAAHTAVTFLVLSLCVLAADSNYGFARIASSDTAGGLVSRRLLPTLPVAIFALGCITLGGQNVGLYDIRFVLALMVLLGTSVCIVAVAWTANTLHKVDVNRKHAETEILNLNAGLELRVQERTRELAQVSSQLLLVNTSLEVLSRQDGLTGLANRRHFDTYLADQLRSARRLKRPLALVFCDVDSFKAYNDRYGHQAGDECLKLVASALRSCCRRPGDMAARYGGEEFAIILPETDPGDALGIAEAIKEAVAALKIVHEKSPTAAHVTISAGIAILRAHNGSAPQLIKDADQALFQAKCLGRNRVAVADAELAQGTA